MIEYSEDLYNDFIMQLGGKRFGHGLFNSFSKDNVKKWTENRLLFCVKMENHKFTLSIVDYAV